MISVRNISRLGCLAICTCARWAGWFAGHVGRQVKWWSRPKEEYSWFANTKV